MPVCSRIGDQDAASAALLVHGSPGDHRIWHRLAALAPPDTHVALLDLPDHGPGPAQPDADMAALERDVEQAARALAPRERLTLVGHSLGAYLVARVLPLVEDVAHRAVLVGGVPGLPPEAAAPRAAFGQAVESDALAGEELAEALRQIYLGAPPHASAHQALVDAMMDATPPNRLVRIAHRLQELAQPAAWVTAYHQPTVIILEQDDPSVPLALGRDLAARGSSAHVVTLPGATHLTPVTHVEEVARWTFGAWSELPAAR